MSQPRVLIADDHRIVAQGLQGLLAEEFDVVGIVEDGRALVEAARATRPDVIVADINMPELNGIEALVQLRRDDAHARVVLLTMHRDLVFARRALEAGALGYVLKHSAASELVLAVRAALQGRTFIAPAIAGEVLLSVEQHAKGAADPAAMLTPRQREILQLLAEGRSAKEVSARLDISPRTVEFHKYKMMESLNLHSSADLVRFAVKHGIADG